MVYNGIIPWGCLKMEEPQVRWMVFSGGKLPKIEKLDGEGIFNLGKLQKYAL